MNFFTIQEIFWESHFFNEKGSDYDFQQALTSFSAIFSMMLSTS